MCEIIAILLIHNKISWWCLDKEIAFIVKLTKWREFLNSALFFTYFESTDLLFISISNLKLGSTVLYNWQKKHSFIQPTTGLFFLCAVDNTWL